MPAPSPFRLVRADDQLAIDVRIDGLEPRPHQPRTRGVAHFDLALVNPAVAGRLAVRFGPQQVMEYAADSNGARLFQERPIFTPSTDVVVTVPPNTPPFAFSVAGILDALRRFALVTNASMGSIEAAQLPAASRRPALELLASNDAAAGRDRARDHARRSALHAHQIDVVQRPAESGSARAAVVAPPAGAVTSFSLPYRMVLHPPGGDTRFDHATEPVVVDGRAGMWHTTLTVDDGTARLDVPLAVNIDARTAGTVNPGVSDTKLRNALKSFHNETIANAASAASPAQMRRLALSLLGATLDLRGDFPGLTFRHSTAVGRDQGQLVVVVGRLYPFGHRAILTSLTSRQIEKGTSRAAALRTDSVISVLDPIVDDRADPSPIWPFPMVELMTTLTPNGTATDPSGPFVDGAQVLAVRNQPFPFPCRATDLDGQVVTFSTPMIFVPENRFDDPNLPALWTAQGETFTTLDLGGQPFVAAPLNDGSPGARASGLGALPSRATVLARTINMKVDAATRKPVVDHIAGIVPALDHIAPGVEQIVSYPAAYVQHQFDALANKGQVFLELAQDEGSKLAAKLAEDATGGLAQLGLPISGLSREFGAVAGPLQSAIDGDLDLSTILTDDLELFGVVKLLDLLPIKPGDLIAKLPLQDPFPTPDVVREGYRFVSDLLEGVRTSDLTFATRLFGDEDSQQFVGTDFFRLQPRRLPDEPDGPNKAFLRIRQHTEIDIDDPATPSVRSRTECTVEEIELVVRFSGDDIVTVPFRKVSFTSVDGKKPDIDVDLARIRFGGLLGFVSRLAELIDDHGFSDPPALDVRDDSIVSSFSFPVPSIAIGMFALENISFGAELQIFFKGDPIQLRFNFATPDNPFRLTVAMLSGGGSLAIGMSTGGLNSIEGVLEFGASLSLDLIVASASVEAMGGVSFRYRRTGDTEFGEVSGFFRVHGELDVLSLISVSVDLRIELRYEFAGPDAGKIVGEAEIAVEVKVIFFSETVVVPFRQKFAGSNGDPTFAELMAPDGWVGPLPWETYCQAFMEA